MDENINLENLQNNEQTNVEKKLTAADLLLKKLNERNISEKEGEKKIEELKEIEVEIKTLAEQSTVIEEDEEEIPLNLPNYNEFSREELAIAFEKLLDKPVEEIKDEAEIIKNTFYKKRNAEINERKEKFVEEGGVADDFKVDNDQTDDKFKTLYDNFKKHKQSYSEQIENEKKKNLETKYSIIDQIEELINKGEKLHKTFDEFHKLREQWNSTGTVNQNDAKPLLEKYNFTLQKFYDWVKINQELRDLDLRKNLEQKIKICEEAELLILEPRITRAYNELQKLHDKWKETGPVPNEQKEEIWTRFKEASFLINKKHYNYFQQVKQEQDDNLKAKELLCEEAEKISNETYTVSKEWLQKTDEMNELLKLWKLIGFAPRKNNNQIFERFITARKLFFEKKQEHFQSYSDVLNKNLQLKEQLVIEAESAKDRDDWNNTSKLFVELQERWKNIGPVPNEKKDEIWHRFNKACNDFFEKKRLHFKNRKDEEQDNLKAKKEIIEKIKNLEKKDSAEETLKDLQVLQKEWSNIGFVPFKVKDEIFKEYHTAVDTKLKQLDIKHDRRQENENNNNNRIDEMLKSDKPQNKIRFEIDKVKNDIDKLSKEIMTLENNISFFVKSKNTESIISNFQKKIDALKEQRENHDKTLRTLVKALNENNK